MVIDLCLTSFCDLFAESLRQGFVNAVRPTGNTTSPLFYAFSLLRSAFDFSFEIVAIRCSSAICASFCCRE